MQTIVGGVVSLTITVCVAVDVLSLLSVTVQVTMVVPNGKLAGALLLTVTVPQLSDTTGVPRLTVAEQLLLLVGRVELDAIDFYLG